MRLILSRKGFDSALGGVPSPVFPDGGLWSLPIPWPGSPVTLGQLQTPFGPLGPAVLGLTRGRIRADTPVHLDPDLHGPSLPRPVGWRPTFGQVAAAQTHLARARVGVGDLFLFFGWFRAIDAPAWRYTKGAPDLHVIFGWLQVGAVLPVTDVPALLAARPELCGNPHLEPGFTRHANNTLYAAAEHLALPGRDLAQPRRGAGLFRQVTARTTLTDAGATTRSQWRLPGWARDGANPPALSYHLDRHRWWRCGEDWRLASVCQGQEFVIDAERHPEVLPWVSQMFA